MSDFTTPMMRQYQAIKQQYTDCLLFYRMGDFYELFLDDALIGAKVLGITLTSRSKGRDGRIPMAGVPYHAVDVYLNKLVKTGYKVAICEQLSEPNKKGLVERDVVRIVTPGTILDEKALEKKENNYIISVRLHQDRIGLSVCDVSTGEFACDEITTEIWETTLAEEFARLTPAECILPPHHYEDKELLQSLSKHSYMSITCYYNWDQNKREEILSSHFGVDTLESFGIAHLPLAIEASSALLSYVADTQKGNVQHIQKIRRLHNEKHLLMDRSTQLNLELFSTIREHDARGSLLSVIDHTRTPMGGRLLKQWIRQPLQTYEEITARLDAVEYATTNHSFFSLVCDTLDRIQDIERMLSRLSANIGNARDLVNLKHSLAHTLSLKKQLSSTSVPLFDSLYTDWETTLQKVIDRIDHTIVDEPRITLKDGGLIKPGVDEKLDALRSLVTQGETWIQGYEQIQRERTRIASLKVRFNSVFGYYIEVTKANLSQVPNDYLRKQTLVNAERFITPELKQHEENILTADEQIKILEYELYQQALAYVVSFTPQIQKAALAIAQLDCIMSFAHVSLQHTYVKPKMLFSNEIRIKDGRHPVVEQLLEDTPFVPNSVTLDPMHQRLLLITGPNMAGKSVFIRQVALIVLLSHMGCFVPAKQAHIGIVDRIFVRSGASDVITSGLSTFMVEMVETAYILHHATEKSLIVMDEIGRGTSTYDGISIAWAVAEYLVSNGKKTAKTLFATHYHELQELEQHHPTRVKNYHMAVVEHDDGPQFLYTVLPGGSESSFGIAVAKRAGIPQKVIAQATRVLENLEKKHAQVAKTRKPNGVKHPESEIISTIRSLKLEHMTPLQALNTLASLQQTVSYENHTHSSR